MCTFESVIRETTACNRSCIGNSSIYTPPRYSTCAPLNLLLGKVLHVTDLVLATLVYTLLQDIASTCAPLNLLLGKVLHVTDLVLATLV